MRIGFLTHVDGQGSAADAYRDTVELAVAAEGLGFHTFWVAQHHGAARSGFMPSPLVLLAALAQHTSSIQLGTAVIAAPLEHPRRLAEDAAVVDALSGGRLQLGLGTGNDAAAAERFGHDHSDRWVEAVEVLDELCAVLTGEGLVPEAAGVRRRMWWATGSASGAHLAAARGMGLITGRLPHIPGSTVLRDLRRYWTRAVDEPRAGVSRVLPPDAAPKQLAAEWATDPTLGWSTELIVQAGPTRPALADRLAAMRMVARELEPALTAALTARHGELATV